MPVVAGTPVIDSPRAWVTTSLPSTVTLTMTAFRFAWAMVSRTIRITASAFGLSALEVGDSCGSAPGAQAVSMTRAQNAPNRRGTTGMPDLDRVPGGIAYFADQPGIPRSVRSGRLVPHRGGTRQSRF